MGIGDWGLGIGDWAQSPIPNPQSPIPNPHETLCFISYNYYLYEKSFYNNLIMEMKIYKCLNIIKI